MVTIERRFKPQEKVKSDAFRVEYRNVPPQVIIDDFVHYLGEYRFNVSKDFYSLKYTDAELRDPNRNESMVQASERAIDLKRREGKPFVREQAETIGFKSLNKKLLCSQTGDTIIWASPPGPKEEGYGDYGFVYFGKVEKNNLEEKNIKMIAMRVENPSIEQFRKAVYMLTGENKDLEFAEEFLDSPKVINEDIQEGYVDAVLKMVFDFKPNTDEEAKFRKIINTMFPLIYDFANNPQRTREDFYALENYALELKREQAVFNRKSLSRLADLGGVYRYEPPKAAGSCGSTSSAIESNNIFNSTSSLNGLLEEDKYGSRTFDCPSCGKPNIRPKDKLISNCQHCGRDVTC